MGEAAARRLAAVHHDGGQRLLRGRLEGCLPSLVDFHKLEQRTEDALYRRQPARPGARPRLVQRLCERLRPG